MKVVRTLGHPAFVISLFLLLIIEGDNFGGIYLLYLLLALPHGAPYAIVAMSGLTTLFIVYKTYKKKLHILKPVLNLIGLGLMLLSLILFFAKGNKNETFEETIPLISFILFASSSLCFLILSVNILIELNLNRSQGLNSVS